mgnify:CR=1 FL=1
MVDETNEVSRSQEIEIFSLFFQLGVKLFHAFVRLHQYLYDTVLSLLGRQSLDKRFLNGLNGRGELLGNLP